MDAQLITVSTTGDLHIPADLQETLGLVPGSRVELTVQEGKLIARPIHFDDIRALRGILSSEKGMVEELQQERRNENLMQGSSLTLSPRWPETSNHEATQELDQLIDELQAIFRGHPSLEDDLYAMRHQDDLRMEQKHG